MRLRPDLLLYGGQILTLDPALHVAEAVAVVGDRILAVGASTDIRRLAPRNPVYSRAIWGYWRHTLPLVSIANSEALRRAGVTRATVSPWDGVRIETPPPASRRASSPSRPTYPSWSCRSWRRPR